jgi:hypothetical protein
VAGSSVSRRGRAQGTILPGPLQYVELFLSGFSVDLDFLARHNPHRFGEPPALTFQALFPDSPRLIGPFQAIPQRIRFANGWLSDGIEIGDRSGNNAKKEDYL